MNSTLVIGTIITALFLSGGAMASELETEQQKLGYIIGMDIGKSLRNEGTEVDLVDTIELDLAPVASCGDGVLNIADVVAVARAVFQDATDDCCNP